MSGLFLTKKAAYSSQILVTVLHNSVEYMNQKSLRENIDITYKAGFREVKWLHESFDSANIYF